MYIFESPLPPPVVLQSRMECLQEEDISKKLIWVIFEWIELSCLQWHWGHLWLELRRLFECHVFGKGGGGVVDLFFKKLPGDLEIWWDLCILQEIENRSCQFEPRHYPWSCLNWPPRIQELQNPRIGYTYHLKFVASIPSRCLPSSPIQRKFNSGQRCLQVCSRWSASDKSISPEGLVMVAHLTLNR